MELKLVTLVKICRFRVHILSRGSGAAAKSHLQTFSIEKNFFTNDESFKQCVVICSSLHFDNICRTYRQHACARFHVCARENQS